MFEVCMSDGVKLVVLKCELYFDALIKTCIGFFFFFDCV